MASEAKLPRRRAPGNELEQLIREQQDDAAGRARDRKARRTVSVDTGGTGGRSLHEHLQQSEIAPPAPERHDAGYVPTGYMYAEGYGLVRSPQPNPECAWPSPAEEAALAHVLERLRRPHAIRVDMPGRSETPLGWPTATREAVHAAYKALTGCRVGETWWRVLRHELTVHARAKAEQRISRGKRLEPARAAEIYGRVRAHAERNREALPGELVPQLIEETLALVNLGGAGGRGRRGAVSVDQALDRLQKVIAKARRRKPRG